MVKMGTVWDRTTEFLGDNLAALMPIALLTIFLPTSVQQNLTIVVATATPGTKAALSLVMVVLWLLMLWGQLAITAMAIDSGPASIEPRPSASSVATRRLLPAIGVLLITGLIMVLLAIPALGVLAAYGFDFSTLSTTPHPSLPDAAKLPFSIAVLITFPVMIWLMARVYVVLTPVVVAEQRGIGAISRSFSLTKGLVLRIVGVMILYGIVAGVAQLAAKTVFGSVFELVAGGEGTMSLATILTSIVVGAVSAAFTVLATVFCAKLYLAASGQEDTSLT
ncbi:hypothetical protein BH09PSE4_BH09PSE4_16920 [soil metagenome]